MTRGQENLVSTYGAKVGEFWIGVCNDRPIDASDSVQGMMIQWWTGAAYTTKLLCSGTQQSGWCESGIDNQEAKAFHYVAGSEKDYRFSAHHVGGPFDNAYVLTRTKSLGRVDDSEDGLCDPNGGDPLPPESTPACNNYCVAVFEYCTGWVGEIDEPYDDFADCMDYCECNWSAGEYEFGQNTTNCRIHSFSTFFSCEGLDRDSAFCGG